MRFALILTLCLIATPSFAKETVVLIHGLARTSHHMGKLEEHLASAGYEVINLNYPSTQHSLNELVPIIHQEITQKTQHVTTLHVVAYSMGSILTRAWISQYHPQHLGRVVMLAPPNHGSEVVDVMGDTAWFQWLYGPAATQLSTNSPYLAQLPQQVEYELGIIACNQFIDPIGGHIIHAPSDGRVSVESSKLDGMKDHITIPVPHPFTPKSSQAINQTLAFLAHGSFQHNKHHSESADSGL